MVLVFAFFLAISLVTALLFYKKWWRKLFELKAGNGKLVLFRSLHRLIGLWTIPFVLVFSVTGIWYFVERTNMGKVSDISNPVAPKLENETLDPSEPLAFSYQLDYDKAAQVARDAIPGLKIKGIVPTNQPSKSIYIRGTSHVPLVRNRANRVYLDPITYQPVMVQKAEKIPTVMYINDIADPLHFGNWGGLATKITWFFGGLAISGLIVTGIWIALRRQVKKMAANGMKPMGGLKYINWLLALIVIGFMYSFMIIRYSLSWPPLVVVGLILGAISWLTWYVFVFRLHKATKG